MSLGLGNVCKKFRPLDICIYFPRLHSLLHHPFSAAIFPTRFFLRAWLGEINDEGDMMLQAKEFLKQLESLLLKDIGDGIYKGKADDQFFVI